MTSPQEQKLLDGELLEEPRWHPSLPSPSVERPHLLSTIATVLSGDVSVVFLEGDDGDGATTLLSQFCAANQANTIALFVKASSRFSYGSDYLRRVLAEQYHWQLTRAPLESDHVGKDIFQGLQLRLRSRTRRQPLFIVVDGIHQIPSEDRRYLDVIFKEVLPIGVEGFKFIISGKQQELAPYLGKETSKSYQILKFSESDARDFLSDLNLEDADRDDIIRICGGNPGRLASVRRMLVSGKAWPSLATANLASYPDFIKEEFRRAEDLSEIQRLFIAMLAHTRHAMSLSQIVGVVPQASIEAVKEMERQCTFLKIDELTDSVEFTSEAHRRYAEVKFESDRKQCYSLQIASLLADPTSGAALRFLPAYYQQLNQTQALIDLIGDKDHYAGLLAETLSLTSLRARATLGARSALELRAVGNVLQFAVHRSIFSSLGTATDFPSEISALVAIGQDQRALDLAARGRTKEAQISLISQYAKGVRVKNATNVDEEVRSYIRELVTSIDFQGWGEAALTIADNLLNVDLDLALSIVDQALSNEPAPGSADSVYAKIVMDASAFDAPNREDIAEKAKRRISDEDLRAIVSSVSSIFNDFSIDEVIRLAADLKIARRMYFLRTIVAHGAKRTGVLRVVDYALGQLISDSSYTPRPRDLADLAIPLANAGSAEDVAPLVKRIESQIGLIDAATSSVDYVVLQMRLAHAELRQDISLAKTRIENTFYFAADVESAEMRVLCLAAMLSSLSAIKATHPIDGDGEFGIAVTGQMDSTIDHLLRNSADHASLFEPAIDSLCISHPDLAIELVAKFNTVRARNAGYVRVAAETTRYELTDERIKIIIKAICCVSNTAHRDVAISRVAAVLRRRTCDEIRSDVTDRLARLTNNPALIARLQIDLTRSGVTCGSPVDLDKVISVFEASLANVDDILRKIDLLFKMSSAIAPHSIDIAAEYHRRGDGVRKDAPISTRDEYSVLTACISLINRALRPLMRFDLSTKEHVQRFATIAELVPSLPARAFAMSELVVRAWCEGKHDLAKSVFHEYCQPMLTASEEGNPWMHRVLSINLCVAAYCAHKGYAFSLFEKVVPESHKDSILNSLVLMVLRRIASSEPSGNIEDEFHKISFATVLDVIELLEKAPTDANFASCVSDACVVISHRGNRTSLTAQQRTEFRDRVLEIAGRKLPDPNNIQHEGYVLVCKAYLGRVVELKTEEWRALISLAGRIDNPADQSFVMLEICGCMPTKLESDRKALLENARTVLNSIPSARDRYSRLEMYIKVARKIDPAEAKSALRKAMILTFDFSDSDDASGSRRALVDLAEQIQPGSSDELAEMIDDDPARAAAKEEVKRSVDVQRLKRDISSADPKKDAKTIDREHLPSAAWKNVSSLHSNRIETKPPEKLIDYLDAAGHLSLREAYPVIAWYLENAAKRYTTLREAEQFLLPLLEIVMLCADVATSVISVNRKAGHAAGLPFPGINVGSSSLLVQPGQRDIAISHIQQWLRTHCGDWLIYCDPYFTHADLAFLRLVLAENPATRVTILTSKLAFDKKRLEFSSASFYAEWAGMVDQDPPHTNIIALSGTPGSSPIHDRWIISATAGLRIGTSFGSLGEGKLSEISSLEDSEAERVAAELKRFCNGERVIAGVRIEYLTASL